MVIITIGHDLMAQALELFCRRCWLLSSAGSRGRKCGPGLRCVAAAELTREDDIDKATVGHIRVTLGHPRETIAHLRVTVGHFFL